jgi:AraC-like DNA-binding protein
MQLSDENTLADGTCYCGVRIVAPIVRDANLIAQVQSGPMLLSRASEETLYLALKKNGVRLTSSGWSLFKESYVKIPLLTQEKLPLAKAMIQVLAIYLSCVVSRTAISKRRIDPRVIEVAKSFIAENSFRTVTAAEVVKQVHLSQCYFCRLFKRTQGTSLQKYIIMKRVTRACALIPSTTMSMTEVASAAGFGSIQQFNEMFRRYVGMSPSSYRRDKFAASRPVAA